MSEGSVIAGMLGKLGFGGDPRTKPDAAAVRERARRAASHTGEKKRVVGPDGWYFNVLTNTYEFWLKGQQKWTVPFRGPLDDNAGIPTGT